MGPDKIDSVYKLLAFDAYGTLCYVRNKTYPYKNLIKTSIQGYKSAASLLMTRPEGIAYLFGVNSETEKEITVAVQKEVDSVTAFDEVIDVLATLKTKGMEIAIISNLSPPYAQPLKQLFDQFVNYYLFSFEIGYSKPEPEIFEKLLETSGLNANEILMVGDSFVSDVVGAKKMGIESILLDRRSRRQSGSILTLDEIFNYIR